MQQILLPTDCMENVETVFLTAYNPINDKPSGPKSESLWLLGELSMEGSDTQSPGVEDMNANLAASIFLGRL